jgi:dTMP kinase
MPFIVFEGGEGTGKSTQASLLAKSLRNSGLSVLETREPGGTPLAEDIRKVFKSVQESGDVPTPRTELLLVMAARSQHIEKTIRPALASGQWIVCDRFLDSSYVYQGFRGNLPKRDIDLVAAPLLGTLQPDLTFVLVVSADIAKQRVAARHSVTPDRLDDELANDTRLHDAFKNLCDNKTPYPNGQVPTRILIDGSGSVDDVARHILSEVAMRLGLPAK